MTTAPGPPNKRLYSIEQLAEHFGASTSTLYKWIAKGDFPRHVRLPNGQVRVLEDDLDVWLLARRSANCTGG